MRRHCRVRRAQLVVLAVAGALASSACGGGGTVAGRSSDGPAAAQGDSTDMAAPAPDLSGDPPADLVVTQLQPPDDPQSRPAQSGDVVAVDYTGRAWSTGEVFDSSLDRNPLPFTLGAGQVIAGWDAGIAGLRVGEKARLVIPPEQAYGETGAPPAIAPNETLVFDVQLVEILEPSSGDPSDAAAG